MKIFKIAVILLLAASLALSSIGCAGNTNKEEVGKDEIISSEKTDKTGRESSETPGQDAGEMLDLGKKEGDIYKNNYFGLSFKLPKDWKVASEEELKQVLNTGKKIAADDNESKQDELDSAESKSAYLIMVSKTEMTGQTYKTGNFMVTADKLSSLQGITNVNQYLEQVKAGMMSIKDQMPYNLDKPIYLEKIGDKEFAVLETSIYSEGIKLTQKYYAYVIKDYVLVFIATSTNEDYAKVIQDMLDSVKFE